MTFRFVSAEQDDSPLNVTLMFGGGSGTGKTYSALTVARSLSGGEPFAVIDTENRRALHHRRSFPMMHHLDLEPDPELGFGPEVYMRAIDAAEKAGYPVIVIDSFSHAHEGIGGILEMQAKALDRLTRGDASKREGLSMLAWAEVKPKERRLVDRIVRCKAHVILCVRAKKMIVDRHGKLVRENKIRRADLPWDLATNRDVVFETTATFLLTPERPGVPVPIKLPDEFRQAFPLDAPIGIEAGKALAEWATGTVRDDKELYDRAREEARKGQKAATEFWQTLSRDQIVRLRPIRDELAKIVKDAEASLAADENPFAPTDPAPQAEDVPEQEKPREPDPEEERRAYEQWQEEQRRMREEAGA